MADSTATTHEASIDTPSSSDRALVEIKKDNELLAIILRASYRERGVNFLTPGDLSQQLAFMRHPKGKEISPHVHNPVERRVTFTQETLFIRKGCMRVDFYDDARQYLSSYELRCGDVILLIKGGHGFVMLEETEFVEVKQGPYAGDQDKTRFTAVQANAVRVLG